MLLFMVSFAGQSALAMEENPVMVARLGYLMHMWRTSDETLPCSKAEILNQLRSPDKREKGVQTEVTAGANVTAECSSEGESFTSLTQAVSMRTTEVVLPEEGAEPNALD